MMTTTCLMIFRFSAPKIGYYIGPTVSMQNSSTTPERQPLLSVTVPEPLLPSWVHVDDEPQTLSRPTSTRVSPPKPSPEEEDVCCCGIDPVLCWFRFFHFIGSIAALFALIANAQVMVFLHRSTTTSITFHVLLMRAYTSCFALLLILIQLQIPGIVDLLLLFQSWIWRGLLFIYVGLNTMNEDWEHLFIEDISGIITICFGASYLLMGLCCMQSIEDRKLRR